MNVKTKYIGGLIGLGLVDAVIPIPIIGIILIYVVLQRPPWFKDLVLEFYSAG